MALVRTLYDLPVPEKIIPFLMRTLGIPQPVAARMVDREHVLVNGLPVIRKSVPVTGTVEVWKRQAPHHALEPLFYTPDFALYDKPSGMLAHPNNPLAEAALTDVVKRRFGPMSNIVHRLDRETSGLVIASRHKRAEAELKALLVEKKVKKSYLAWVKGKLEGERRVDVPLLNGREVSDTPGHVIGAVSPAGKPSVTEILPIRYVPEKNLTLVEARPLTGRTHQIRLHLDYLGHPILGDPIYGVPYEAADAYLNKRLEPEERAKVTGADRLMLHAWKLEFVYKTRLLVVAEGFEKLF